MIFIVQCKTDVVVEKDHRRCETRPKHLRVRILGQQDSAKKGLFCSLPTLNAFNEIVDVNDGKKLL
jgi:hypothetical protein